MVLGALEVVTDFSFLRLLKLIAQSNFVWWHRVATRPPTTVRSCATNQKYIWQSFQLMHIVQHAAGNADDEHFQVAPRFVLHTTRHVHDRARAQLYLLLIQPHSALAIDD